MPNAFKTYFSGVGYWSQNSAIRQLLILPFKRNPFIQGIHLPHFDFHHVIIYSDCNVQCTEYVTFDKVSCKYVSHCLNGEKGKILKNTLLTEKE